MTPIHRAPLAALISAEFRFARLHSPTSTHRRDRSSCPITRSIVP